MTQRFANRLQSGAATLQRKWCKLGRGRDSDERRAEAQSALDVFYNGRCLPYSSNPTFDVRIGEFLLKTYLVRQRWMVQPGDGVAPVNFVPVPQYLVAFRRRQLGRYCAGV